MTTIVTARSTPINSSTRRDTVSNAVGQHAERLVSPRVAWLGGEHMAVELRDERAQLRLPGGVDARFAQLLGGGLGGTELDRVTRGQLALERDEPVRQRNRTPAGGRQPRRQADDRTDVAHGP